MKVWVVVSGVCYESSEVIEGVYRSEEKAKDKNSRLPNNSLYYSYVQEMDVE